MNKSILILFSMISVLAVAEPERGGRDIESMVGDAMRGSAFGDRAHQAMNPDLYPSGGESRAVAPKPSPREALVTGTYSIQLTLDRNPLVKIDVEEGESVSFSYSDGTSFSLHPVEVGYFLLGLDGFGGKDAQGTMDGIFDLSSEFFEALSTAQKTGGAAMANLSELVSRLKKNTPKGWEATEFSSYPHELVGVLGQQVEIKQSYELRGRQLYHVTNDPKAGSGDRLYGLSVEHAEKIYKSQGYDKLPLYVASEYDGVFKDIQLNGNRPEKLGFTRDPATGEYFRVVQLERKFGPTVLYTEPLK